MAGTENEASFGSAAIEKAEDEETGMRAGGLGFGVNTLADVAGGVVDIFPKPSTAIVGLGISIVGVVTLPMVMLAILSSQTPSAVQTEQINRLVASNEKLAAEASKFRCIGLCFPQDSPTIVVPGQTAPTQPITYQQPVQTISAVAAMPADPVESMKAQLKAMLKNDPNQFWNVALSWGYSPEYQTSNDPTAVALRALETEGEFAWN